MDLHLGEKLRDAQDDTVGFVKQNGVKLGLLSTSAGLFHVINCIDNPELSPTSPEAIIDSIYFWITSITTIGFGDKHPESTQSQILFLIGLALAWGSVGKYIANRREAKRNPEKRFSDETLQISLSVVRDGVLLIDKIRKVDRIEEVLGSDGHTTHVIKRAIHKAKSASQDDPFLHFTGADKEIIASLIEATVKQLLQRDLLAIGEKDTELVTDTYYAALTWEKYDMTRNLRPRLLVVPEWNLQGNVLDTAQHQEGKDHQSLRLTTMRKMRDDISSGNPTVCFPIQILRPSTKPAHACQEPGLPNSKVVQD